MVNSIQRHRTTSSIAYISYKIFRVFKCIDALKGKSRDLVTSLYLFGKQLQKLGYLIIILTLKRVGRKILRDKIGRVNYVNLVSLVQSSMYSDAMRWK
jgi:hypothetical protein